MRLNRGEGNGVSLDGRTRKVPTASPAPTSMWPFAGLSWERYCHELSTAMEWIPTAVETTARLSTACKCAVLQVFLLLASYCGRCGRYSDQLY